MMDYATFKTVVEKNIKDYLPENFKDAQVEVTKITKVNRTKEALTIRPDKDTKIAPNFYLEDMYEHYRECDDLDEVLGRLADEYIKHTDNCKNMVVPDLTKEYVEDNVIMVMINTESNKDLLQNVPHREINDCSVIYRIVVSMDSNGIASTIVDHRIADDSGMTEQELFASAVENTKRILPAKIQPMTSIIMEVMVGEGMPREIAESMIADINPGDEMMWVISNDIGVNGAVNMLYDENLHELAEKLNDDLYVLPSSIHEVICVPASMGEPEELADMVQEVNMTTVRLEERLSNQVYHYDKDLRKLTMATDTPNRRIDGIVAEQPLIYGGKEQKR